MSVAEKLRRLRQMSAPEVTSRLAQRWRIQKEQWGLAANGTAAPWHACWNADTVSHHALRERLQAGDGPGATALLPAYFARRRAPAFFLNPAKREEVRAAHLAAFPGRLENLRAEADRICQRRFRIFAYPDVQAGDRVPWHRDMVHGKEAARVHWARVPYLNFEKAGDSKIVWEPNRHQHFIALAQAYLLTEDERYAEECMAQWDDWLGENPRGIGINWSSSLELGFRLWSWFWALHMLQPSPALTGMRLAAISKSIFEHAEFIRQNLSTYFSPNTHLLGEAFALFCTGVLFPELQGAEAWRDTGRQVLLEQMERQVRADGWHVEQSTYYHRYAVDFFQCALLLADRNGCPFPGAFSARLARMCEVILQTRLPSGKQAMIGDADGGRLLAFSSPPGPAETHDQRGALCTAALGFARPDFRFAAERLHEETFWLFGPGAVERWHRLPAREPRTASHAYRDAGCVVMRDGIGTASRVLLFDAGPQGLGGCAHGHADALSIVCGAEGEDWLIDPGTFVYTGSPEWRMAFSGTRAHNTVAVDGRDQATPVDIFKWRELPEVRLEAWHASDALTLAVGAHRGYMRAPAGVLHRRRIAFVAQKYWVVTDELSGKGEHAAEFWFHFAPETNLDLRGAKCLASRGAKKFLLASTASSFDWKIFEGDERERAG